MTLVTPKANAQEVRARVMENNLFDPGRTIGRGDGLVYFPILVRGDLKEVRSMMGPLMEDVRMTPDTSATPARSGLRPPIVDPLTLARTAERANLAPLIHDPPRAML